MKTLLPLILIVATAYHSLGQKTKDLRVGVNFDYRVTRNLISQLSFSYKEQIQLDIGGGKATYDGIYLQGFEQNTISGYYYGIGLSAEAQVNKEEAKIRSFVTSGFKIYRGKADVVAKDIVRGNVYDDFVYTVSLQDQKFRYFEYNLGVKIKLGKHVAIHALPFIIETSSIERAENYRTNFAPLGRYTGLHFSLGGGIQFLW